MVHKIKQLLPGDHPWQNQIHHFACVESTNTLAKEMAKQGAPHGTVLIADSQTGGRGRLGRHFHSPADMGIYMSVILRYGCKAEKLMHLTCACGVSICDAVAECIGIRPGIKWTNDLVHQGKKLGGILTELVFCGEEICAIVGIGLNCSQNPTDFDQEIRPIAASLTMISDQKVAREQVAAAMIRHLLQMDAQLLADPKAIMERYRKDCITIGKEISLLRGDTVRHGIALEVEDDGALLVRFIDGSTEAVQSGEVSVRGMYGYV